MSESIAGGQTVELPVKTGESLKIGYLGGTYTAVAIAGRPGLPEALATNANTSQTLGPWAQNIVVRLSTSANGRVEYAVGKPPVFAPSGQRFVRTSDGVPVELKGLGANAEYLAAGSSPTAPASLAASGSYSTSLTEGTRYESAAPTVTGGVPPYAFGSAGGALPYGMRIDPDTGVLYGVPSFQGSFGGAKVRVTDQLGNFVDMTVGTITVGAPSGLTVPGAPAAPTATAGDGTVSLAFAAPSTGGSPILEYGALLSNGNANTGNPSASPVSVVTPNGVAVTGQIRARNAIGWGPYSPASNSVTPSAAGATAVSFSRRVGAPSQAQPNTGGWTQFNTSCRLSNDSGAAINRVRLKYVNAIVHASNGTMIAGPNITSMQVGISQPGTMAGIGGARTLLTFGGQTTIALAAGEEIWSDEFTFTTDMAAGQYVRLMANINYESAPARLPTCPMNALDNSNELSEGGTGALASKALTGNPSSRIANKVLFMPAAAVGVPVGTPAAKRYWFFGDSITTGSDDATGSNIIGFAQRGVHATLQPWAISATEGATWVNIPAGGNARRFLLSSSAGANVFLSFLGVNDIRSGRVSADVRADMQSLKNDLVTLYGPGTKLIVSTIWPVTNAANTAEEAASPGVWTRLNQINADIRANNGIGDGYFDINMIARDPVNNNLWRTDLGTPHSDGVHPSAVIHTAVATELTAFLNALP